MTSDPRPLVIGVGNRDRGDDAIGPTVADLAADRWPGRVEVAVVEGDLSALALAWGPDHRVVVVDAAVTGGAVTDEAVTDWGVTDEGVTDGGGPPPGTIRALDAIADPLPAGHAPMSTHGIGMARAVELARVLGRLPRELTVVAVEAVSFDHGAPLSGPVAAAVDDVVDRVGAVLGLDPDPDPGSAARGLGSGARSGGWAANAQSRSRI